MSPLRIALLGFGTVGSAVARRLARADAPRDLVVTQICDRRADEKRAMHLNLAFTSWTSRIEDVWRGDATGVSVISDLVAVARDRAASVPPLRLSSPRVILGFGAATNTVATTWNAEPAEPAETRPFCELSGLGVDRFLHAEAV